jgi:phage gpG-like protein
MTLISDSLELDSFAAFNAMLNDMIQPLATPTLQAQTWQDVIDVLQEMERGYFASSAGPSGEPWAPNAPLTILKKGHGIVLRDTYELESSLTGSSGTSIRKIASDSLEFGTSREWAWTHQNGEGIVQREFLGMNEDSMKDVLDIVADAAVEMMFA